MQSIDFTITQSSIDNGRLYFEAGHINFFPSDAVGGRGATEHAAGKIHIAASGVEVETDIRQSSTIRISPRKSFKNWLNLVCAINGGTARLHRIAERYYTLEYIG
ncbi:MAG: hypothetical protein ABI574_11740 [Burkholderiales bacterium]